MALQFPDPLTGEDLDHYRALQTGAVAFARPGLHHLEFTGAKAADALTGLVTNNVLALAVGGGQYAAALTAKGRVVADLRIARLSDERFLTTCNAAAWPGWRDVVRKFVNPRLARYAEASWHTVSLHGPAAGSAMQSLLRALGVSAPPEMPQLAYESALVPQDAGELLLVGSPALGDVPGFDLLVPESLWAAVETAINADAALPFGGAALWEVVRVESGRGEWGRDMDEVTIPQEANLQLLNAISFDKGCYTGQETVARIHFRGHVNRHLRVLTSATPLPVPSELRSADGKLIGDVRSSAVSPRNGAMAIAMVRREFGVGDVVQVVWPDADGAEQAAEATVAR